MAPAAALASCDEGIAVSAAPPLTARSVCNLVSALVAPAPVTTAGLPVSAIALAGTAKVLARLSALRAAADAAADAALRTEAAHSAAAARLAAAGRAHNTAQLLDVVLAIGDLVLLE
jgi:hypothetical protein